MDTVTDRLISLLHLLSWPPHWPDAGLNRGGPAKGMFKLHPSCLVFSKVISQSLHGLRDFISTNHWWHIPEIVDFPMNQIAVHARSFWPHAYVAHVFEFWFDTYKNSSVREKCLQLRMKKSWFGTLTWCSVLVVTGAVLSDLISTAFQAGAPEKQQVSEAKR